MEKEGSVLADFDLDALIMENIDNNSATTNASIDDVVECPICHEVSQQPFLHYGAKACTSCRAFFRRAVQKNGDTEDVATMFVCRANTNTCVLTPTTRKKCQSCRFQACLKAGMRPECVMSDAQKRRRFRNVLKLQNDESGAKWKWTPRKRSNNVRNPRLGNPVTICSSNANNRPIRERLTSSSSSGSSPLRISSVDNTSKFTAASWPMSPFVGSQTSWSPSHTLDEASTLNSPSSSSLYSASFDDPTNASLGISGLSSELRCLSVRASALFDESDRVWLSDQISKLRFAYRQIDLGPEMIREIVMYRFGEPLSKQFVPRVLNVFVERFRRVLSISFTYSHSNPAQKQILMGNVYRASALMFARACSSVTGAQQIRELVGAGDEEVLKNDFAPLTDLGQLRKLHMREINAVNSIMDENTLASYCDHIQRLAAITNESDDELFFLTLLTALFKVDEYSKCSDAYKYLVHKRLKTISREDEQGFHRRSQQFKEAIHDIDALANILRSMKTQ